jgi:hypothetical protein
VASLRRIQSADLKSPDDIRKAASAYGLEKTTVDALIKSTEFKTPFDAARHVEARKLIQDYKYNEDADGKKYEEAWTFIQTHIDKDNQEFFESKLKAKVTEGMDLKGGSAQQRERDQALNKIKFKDENAMIVDPNPAALRGATATRTSKRGTSSWTIREMSRGSKTKRTSDYPTRFVTLTARKFRPDGKPIPVPFTPPCSRRP